MSNWHALGVTIGWPAHRLGDVQQGLGEGVQAGQTEVKVLAGLRCHRVSYVGEPGEGRLDVANGVDDLGCVDVGEQAECFAAALGGEGVGVPGEQRHSGAAVAVGV